MLAEAAARAQGIGGEAGPVYLDFPVDTLRGEVCRAVQLPEYFSPAAALPQPPHQPMSCRCRHQAQQTQHQQRLKPQIV